MKTKLLIAGGMVLSAAAGAVIAVVVCKYHFERLSNEEIAEMRRYYQEKEEKLEEDICDFLSIVEETAPETADILKEKLGIINISDAKRSAEIGQMIMEGFKDGMNDQRQKTEYHRVIMNQQYVNPDIEELLAEREHPRDDIDDCPDPDTDLNTYDTGATKPISERSQTPYEISKEEFAYGDTSFDKETLMYYMGDDTLCEYEGEDILQKYDIVGDLLDEFIGDIIFIRNERLGMDYEIICSDKSYSEYVLGMPPQEPKRPPSRNRRALDEDE